MANNDVYLPFLNAFGPTQDGLVCSIFTGPHSFVNIFYRPNGTVTEVRWTGMQEIQEESKDE